jgi:hypothetical protein
MQSRNPKRRFQRYAGLIAYGLIAWSAAAFAGGYDGTTPLAGVTATVVEVNRYRVIEDVDPVSIGLPKAFLIDFAAGVIRPSKESLVRKVAKIGTVLHVENSLVLQGIDEGVAGVEDGLAWSLTISKTDGSAILSASAKGVAYVVFGQCTPTPAVDRPSR